MRQLNADILLFTYLCQETFSFHGLGHPTFLIQNKLTLLSFQTFGKTAWTGIRPLQGLF